MEKALCRFYLSSINQYSFEIELYFKNIPLNSMDKNDIGVHTSINLVFDKDLKEAFTKAIKKLLNSIENDFEKKKRSFLLL